MVKLNQYFWEIVGRLPSLIAMVGGIVFALIRWKSKPKVSLMVVLGLGLMLVHVFVFLIVYDVVPPIFLRGISATTTMYETADRIRRNLFLTLDLISNALLAVPFALLLAGVFMGRKRSAETAQGQS
ncbi:MAG TPA: hypothetical protein VK557_08875 [Pyrinomonadaceae bacterium]|nr:hypothetical protein [Pyrinomonadaceae bacterium]